MEVEGESAASALAPQSRVGPVRKWVSRLRPQSLLRHTWFAVLTRSTSGSSVLVLYCSASNSWFRFPLSAVPAPTFTSSNAGLLCFYKELRSGRELHVVNTFKEHEWTVALAPKTKLFTSAVLSSGKVVAIGDMEDGEYPRHPHIVVYDNRSWRKIHRFEPMEYLEYYPCNVVVGEKVYFLAKDGSCGYNSLLCYDSHAEALVRKQLLMVGFDDETCYPRVPPHLCHCNGKLLFIDTELNRRLLEDLYDDDFRDDYKPITGLTINQLNEETGRVTELSRMPREMMQELVESSDMYSHLRVSGSGKFVFIQFDHFVPWAGYAELVRREKAVICDVETGSWLLTPKKTMKYKQLMDVFPLDPARSLEYHQ